MRERLRIYANNQSVAHLLFQRSVQAAFQSEEYLGIPMTNNQPRWVCKTPDLPMAEQLSRLAVGEVDLVISPATQFPYPLPHKVETIALCAEEEIISGPDTLTDESPPFRKWHVIAAREGNPELRVLFHRLDLRQRWGKVWLVGFGPGDPELMTLKADRLLRQADIIYHDDLIDQAVLNRYPGEKQYVGKRKGHHHESQQAINERLFQSAMAGQTVVRLKGGDPFIFGRGGEETEYLLRRFVAVEVVPGVGAANAAAASCNIPLTKRGISRSVAFRTAHCGNSPSESREAENTLVYFMAASRLAALSQDLLAEGLNPATPAALVKNASLGNESCLISTVEKLREVNVTSPVLVIIGPVVKEQSRARTLIYTGSDLSQARFTDRLVHYPLERIGTIGIPLAGQKLFAPPAFDTVGGIIFCSPRTVDCFVARHGIPPRRLVIYAADLPTLKRLLAYGVHRERMIVLSGEKSGELSALSFSEEPEFLPLELGRLASQHSSIFWAD